MSHSKLSPEEHQGLINVIKAVNGADQAWLGVEDLDLLIKLRELIGADLIDLVWINFRPIIIT